MLSKPLLRSLYVRQGYSSFATTSWLESVKTTVLSFLPLTNNENPPENPALKGTKVPETQKSFSEAAATVPQSAVSMIIERFPKGNSAASLEVLAELGSHFNEARSLVHFHRLNLIGYDKINTSSSVEDLQLRVVKQLSTHTVLDIYKALAVLGISIPHDVHDSVFTMLTQKVEDLNLSQVSNLFQARFLLNADVDYETLAVMADILTNTLKRSKKREIKDAMHVVRILELFAKHNLKSNQCLLEITEFLKGRVQGLSPSDLVDVVASLTVLNSKDEKLFDAIVVEVLQRGADLFAPSQISTLAASLTKSGHFDVMTDVLLDSLAISCKNRVQELKFEELVDLLWAYSHHMHFHHDDRLLSSLTKSLVEKLPEAKAISGWTAAKLCEVISAADAGNDASAVIMETVSNRASMTFGSLQTQELLSVLESCKKVKFYCENLLVTLRDQFLARKDELSSVELCSLVNDYAELDFNPGDEILKMALIKTTMFQEMNSTQICNAIWSLVYFNYLSLDNSQPLFDQLGQFSRSKFNALDIQKLLLAEKLLLAKEDTSVDIPVMKPIPEPLRSELVEMWRERIYFTRSVSPFQQEISRTLTNLNISHEAEALIDNGDLGVDFLLFTGKGDSKKNVVLECDGPRRRSINFPYRPLGQTLTFKRLLRAQDWTVLIVSKQEWQAKSPSDREQHLLSLLDQCT